MKQQIVVNVNIPPLYKGTKIIEVDFDFVEDTEPVEGEVLCPLCEEYADKPASIESHISGSQDDVHEGYVGKQFRDEIADRIAAEASE